MRTQLTAALSLALGTLLLVGAGCNSTDTTTTNTTTANTTTVKVDKTDTVDDDDATTDEDTDTVEDADETGDVDTSSISIAEPVDGDIVASTFDVEVEIDGLTLAPDKVEGANVEGEGHYHIWVDGEYFAPGVAFTTSVADLAAGEHELMVSLQNNDHSDLDPAVSSEPITVTVK